MWPIRDFCVNIKLFNVRAGGQTFTNMEIVIEDKIKENRRGNFQFLPLLSIFLYGDNAVFQSVGTDCYKSESFRISKANPSSLVPWFCRL